MGTRAERALLDGVGKPLRLRSRKCFVGKQSIYSSGACIVVYLSLFVRERIFFHTASEWVQYVAREAQQWLWFITGELSLATLFCISPLDHYRCLFYFCEGWNFFLRHVMLVRFFVRSQFNDMRQGHG